MLKLIKKYPSQASTIIGALVAIAQAWNSVDWKNFDWKKEWPALLLSGMIALGGYLTSLNIKK